MTTPEPGFRFPARLPPIRITPLDVRLDPIDCAELQWWFAIPRPGDRTACAQYDLDTGLLDFSREVVASTPAPVPAEPDAVELVVRENRHQPSDRPDEPRQVATFRFTCVLGPDHARWLAVTTDTPDGQATTTTADPDFASQWGETGPRRLVDEGRFRTTADNALELDGPTACGVSGAGTFRVEIGPRSFTCLRVIDLTELDESCELNVAYVSTTGRTVLYRQYRGRGMDSDWRAWRAGHPGTELTVDGRLFLRRNCTGRAHEVLTSTGLGL